MAVGTPAPDAIDLYNKLLHLPFSATTEIKQIAWRLRWPRQRDGATAVAYLQTQIMLGQAAKAREVADSLWDQRYTLPFEVAGSFAAQLGMLGCYDRASDFIKALGDKGEIKPLPVTIGASALNASLWRGDLDKAEAIIRSSQSKEQGRIASFREELNQVGLAPHFAVHQKIVHNAVADIQCTQSIFINTEEGVEFRQSIFVKGTREERRRIEDRIDDALAEYWRSVRLEEAAHIPLITTSVLDIASHWPQIYDRNAA